MKSERISIFNYEAFYLDHLEGNLGDEDTALLLDFLENHPDLIVEEDDFIVLDPRDETAIFSDKESLKIVSDDAAIVLTNVEHFLIAESEGQLTASKQNELNAFVNQHPHLEKERTYLGAMFLKADDTVLFSDKDSLKRVSDEVAIVLANVEHFLIAESEGQLTTSKQKELNAFVSQHPHLENERAYFAAMFLKADTSIVYADKAGLKKKGAIILWPYIMLAAASILIALMVVMNFEPETPGIARDSSEDKKESPKQEMPIQEPQSPQIAEDIEPSNLLNDKVVTNPSLNPMPNERANVVRDIAPQRQQIAAVNPLRSQKARGLVGSMDSASLQPVTSTINPLSPSVLREDDMAKVENTEMKNPIKPITSRLGKTLKTNVDFQTGKAANNSGGGFFLKIGKLEISRKKGKKKN
jgi:hypothetical protein